MIGDHCIAALGDAYVKGIGGFDIRKAYEGMRRNAFESPATHEEYINGMGRRALLHTSGTDTSRWKTVCPTLSTNANRCRARWSTPTMISCWRKWRNAWERQRIMRP